MASGLPLVALLLISSVYFAESVRHSKSHVEQQRGVIQPGPENCYKGWQKFGTRCFKFFSQAKQWADAEDFCNRESANLASIHSREEDNFLSDLSRYRLTWVGANDAVKEGRWMWSDGSSFSYTNWAPGKPNNRRKREDCLEINYEGSGWNDDRCKKRKPFICVKRP